MAILIDGQIASYKAVGRGRPVIFLHSWIGSWRYWFPAMQFITKSFRYQNLTMHGYDVFFDYLSIDSGNFEKVILDNIRARAHFLIILTPSALDRCKETGDWLRREIETAIDEKRNVVPLMMESFDFGSRSVNEALTGKLTLLSSYNGLRIPADYALEAMDRLRERYLNIALSDVTLPTLQADAQEITITQKETANNAAPVTREQLTAQEWFERGNIFNKANNRNEAIRCFSEVIRLQPDFVDAYNNRGNAYRAKGNLDDAIHDYTHAIHIDGDYSKPYYNRGVTRNNKGDMAKAKQDLIKAISLNPNYGNAYNVLGAIFSVEGDIEAAMTYFTKGIEAEPDNGGLRISMIRTLRLLGRSVEAAEQEKIARSLIFTEIEYNQACFEALCGNIDKALLLLKIGLDNGQTSKEWARQDPDLEILRDDPRFKKLVGD
ncbi:MAG: tetratricopeptide repeat protein [Anaerolineales bacterium]|nr:tetratricopeptide repeat protein [Anaerolineales bacterium]